MACSIKRGVLAVALLVALAGSSDGAGPNPADKVDWDAVKRRWSSLTPAQREHYLEVAAASWSGGAKTPANCPDATFELGALPFSDSNTTASESLGDSIHLGADGDCAGGGFQLNPQTGLGRDIAYKIQVDTTCDLRVVMDPAVVDLSLYIVTDCTMAAASCVRVSDGSGSSLPEVIDFTAMAGVTYWVVVDGFNLLQGEFDLSIAETSATGCMLVPVELQTFTVD